MPRTFQSKGFVLKTVSRPALDAALSFVRGVAGSRWAYALHEPSPPKVPHWHLVALFVDRVYWLSCSKQVHSLDPCASDDSCRKPRRAVRYLLHLDSPEKHPVLRESLVTGGDWGPDELDDWLDSSSAATSIVDTCLSLWRDGLAPLEAFSRLVQFGYEPFQISAALQAFSRLHEFWLKQAPLIQRGMGTNSPHQCIHGAPQQNRGGSEASDIQCKKNSENLSDALPIHKESASLNGVDEKSKPVSALFRRSGDFSRRNEGKDSGTPSRNELFCADETSRCLSAFFFPSPYRSCDFGAIKTPTKQQETYK